MYLYHFTDKEKLKEIKPCFFGKNYYTNNDKNISNVKRAFFYDRPKAQEYLLNSAQYCYKVKIDKNKMYDLSKDKKGYIEKFKSIDKALRVIKKEYQGITYNNGFQCYCLFNSIKTKKV